MSFPTTSTSVTDRSHGSLADRVTRSWDRVPGYLNAATLGLPPRAVVTAMRDAVAEWAAGKACPNRYDGYVNAARGSFADLVGVPADRVAVGSQTSVFAGMVAASLPDGAEVVAVEDDFTSILFPFLVQVQRDRGVTVRLVPREGLAQEVREGTDLVVFSLAQSACGRLVDVPAVTEAAARHGARTFCDLTQAAGWMPVRADLFDLTVCSAYKWLCQPRGTAYLTVRPEHTDSIMPVNAGWYAGESIWESTYGPGMHLAGDARRFDVSPAWLSWVGAAAAGEVFAQLSMEDVRSYVGALADQVREALGQDPCGRPVLALPDPDGVLAARLTEAGAVVASRGGGVRIAFHLWNTDADVDLVRAALTR